MLTPSAIDDLRKLRDSIDAAETIYHRERSDNNCDIFQATCSELGYLQACIRSCIPTLDRIIQEATTCEVCGEPSEGAHECCPDGAITIG